MSEAFSVLFSIIHVIAAVIIILVVLLQPGKAGAGGLTFGGGGSQSVFGASGGITFLAKATIVAVVVFMCSSVILSYLAHPRSAVDNVAAETAKPDTKAETALPTTAPGAVDVGAAQSNQQPLTATPAPAPSDAAAPAAAAPEVPAAAPAAPAAPATP